MSEQEHNDACPFCGGEYMLMYSGSAKYNKLFGWIECEICGGRTRSMILRGDPEDDGFFTQLAYKRLYALWVQRSGKE